MDVIISQLLQHKNKANQEITIDLQDVPGYSMAYNNAVHWMQENRESDIKALTAWNTWAKNVIKFKV